MDTLVVNGLGIEKRYGLLKDDQLEKLFIEQPQQKSMVGRIYYGTVEKVLPGMNAAFIDIGLEKNGYIHRDKLPAFLTSREDKSMTAYLHQGEKLLVQVEKDPTGEKGPRLSGIIEFNGRMTVYMPKGHHISVSKKIDDLANRDKWRQFGNRMKDKEEGFLFRTVCMESTEEEVKTEIEQHRESYRKLLQISNKMKKPGLVWERDAFVEEIYAEILTMSSGTVVVDTLELKQQLSALNQNSQIEILYDNKKGNIFSTYQLEHELEKTLNRVVLLENGAHLVFDEAEALTVIDINTGKFSGKSDIKNTVLTTNELAAVEIGRQIRLRDLAGMILVDFIDMKSDKERDRVRRKLEIALRSDNRRTRVVGFTPLGILQMTRRKMRVSISEALTSTCPTCEGSGRVLSAETIAFQLERELLEHRGRDEEAVLIETTAEVKEVFAGDKGKFHNRLEEIVGLHIYYSTKEASKPFYRIRHIGDLKDVQTRAD